MRNRRTLYIVCYDICGKNSQRRLRKVYRTLRGYGEHLQYSVFRCTLTELQLARLEAALDQEIDHHKDQVLFVPLGNANAPGTWGMYTMGMPLDDPERIVRIV